MGLKVASICTWKAMAEYSNTNVKMHQVLSIIVINAVLIYKSHMEEETRGMKHGLFSQLDSKYMNTQISNLMRINQIKSHKMVLCFYLKEPKIQHVQSSFSNDNYERLENHFEKLEEVFVPNTSKNDNLSHFSQGCCIFGESNPSLSPNFRISEFPCLTQVFEMQIQGK